MRALTREEFAGLLPNICVKETSQSPDGWTPENPLYGHCAVVSLLAQDHFGGELLRASLEGTDFAFMRSHYWNKLWIGDEYDFDEYDFTAPQFGSNYPAHLVGEKRERGYLLSNEGTKSRYKLLAWRLAMALYPQSPLFDDAIFKKCFFTALDSPCQKMKFGCVITHFDEVVSSGCNKPLEPIARVCEPVCVRLGIQSRTDSMAGACYHAEEYCLWETAKKRIDLRECELHILGLYPNGLPWFKTEGEHTCIRCCVQMYLANPRWIFVPTVSGWRAIPPEEALETALPYALKEKKVE